MSFFFCDSTTVGIPSQHIMQSLKRTTETGLWEGWRPLASIAPCKYDVLELYLSVPVNTLRDPALPNLVAEDSQETPLIQEL